MEHDKRKLKHMSKAQELTARTEIFYKVKLSLCVIYFVISTFDQCNGIFFIEVIIKLLLA